MGVKGIVRKGRRTVCRVPFLSFFPIFWRVERRRATYDVRGLSGLYFLSILLVFLNKEGKKGGGEGSERVEETGGRGFGSLLALFFEL